jgi:hypothetical protein
MATSPRLQGCSHQPALGHSVYWNLTLNVLANSLWLATSRKCSRCRLPSPMTLLFSRSLCARAKKIELTATKNFPSARVTQLMAISHNELTRVDPLATRMYSLPNPCLCHLLTRHLSFPKRTYRNRSKKRLTARSLKPISALSARMTVIL